MENGGFIRFDLVTREGEVEVTRSVLNWEGSMKSEISNGKFVPKVGYQNKYLVYNKRHHMSIEHEVLMIAPLYPIRHILK